jgi:hypothetical protein
MKSFAIFLSLAVVACFAFADDDPYASPDWGYAYWDPHYIPDSSPEALHTFHDEMIPMMEARGHAESAYIRENAWDLYLAAKDVPGSLDGGTHYQSKYYNKAARELVRDCKELHTLAYGAPSWVLYDKMREVESDFLRCASLSE